MFKNIHKKINLYHYSENTYTYHTYTHIINIYQDQFSIYTLCCNPLSSFIACPSIIFFYCVIWNCHINNFVFIENSNRKEEMSHLEAHNNIKDAIPYTSFKLIKNLGR